MTIDSLEQVTTADRALVIGIGGGGDVVSTISTARFLELFATEVILGGVAWIPAPRDTKPGPRPLDELTDITVLESHIAEVSPDTETDNGVSIPEAVVTDSVANDVLVLDISDGVTPVVDALESLIDRQRIDLVIGIDAGGDALARGDEPGLRSPLSDAIGLGVLDGLTCPSVLGVIGYGSDGELTHDELETAVSELAIADAFLGAWGITSAVRDEVTEILELVDTEASRIPIEAAGGEFGKRSIRNGRRTVTSTPASPVTYYFKPTSVADRSTIVDVVRNAPSLEAAAETLRKRGLTTEFDVEAERLR